jgi:hypothetical protein
MLRTQTGLDKTPGINRTLAVHDPSSRYTATPSPSGAPRSRTHATTALMPDPTKIRSPMVIFGRSAIVGAPSGSWKSTNEPSEFFPPLPDRAPARPRYDCSSRVRAGRHWSLIDLHVIVMSVNLAPPGAIQPMREGKERVGWLAIDATVGALPLRSQQNAKPTARLVGPLQRFHQGASGHAHL